MSLRYSSTGFVLDESDVALSRNFSPIELRGLKRHGNAGQAKCRLGRLSFELHLTFSAGDNGPSFTSPHLVTVPRDVLNRLGELLASAWAATDRSVGK